MKTVVVKMKGEPKEGDLIIIAYRGPRGGRTHAMHRVRYVGDPKEALQLETLADVTSSLVREITKTWMQDCFEARVKDGGSTLVIQCQDMVSNVVFESQIEGSDAVKITIDEF